MTEKTHNIKLVVTFRDVDFRPSEITSIAKEIWDLVKKRHPRYKSKTPTTDDVTVDLVQ